LSCPGSRLLHCYQVWAENLFVVIHHLITSLSSSRNTNFDAYFTSSATTRCRVICRLPLPRKIDILPSALPT
jgi:hypothetical protein